MVTGVWSSGGVWMDPVTATTGRTGEAKFTLRGTSDGFCVTGVVKAGYDYWPNYWASCVVP